MPHAAQTTDAGATLVHAGIDIIRSVLASNLPRSFYPTFSPSNPDVDGYLVEVLPSLQVYIWMLLGLPSVLQRLSIWHLADTCSWQVLPVSQRCICPPARALLPVVQACTAFITCT